MSATQAVFSVATVCGGLAMWLLLPRGGAPGRALGVVLGMISLGLFGSRLPLALNVDAIVLVALSVVTVVAAAAAVTFRAPVYCAVWFGLSLVGTAGLFLCLGAQFLGVATIVVYAGAILVTFLFVLMLAQPTGHAFYDRLSWEALLSAATGAVMVGILTLTITRVFDASSTSTPTEGQSNTALAAKFTPEELAAGVLADQHVAGIGRELFSRHLIAVEVAGTLLLVALVGAIAIVANTGSSRRDARSHNHG